MELIILTIFFSSTKQLFQSIKKLNKTAITRRKFEINFEIKHRACKPGNIKQYLFTTTNYKPNVSLTAELTTC